MKKLFFIGAFLLTPLFAFFALAQDVPKMIFFYGKGCPHCANVESYFDKNQILSKFDVEMREVYFDRENALYFNKVLADLNVPEKDRGGVPTLIVGKEFILGDKDIIAYFEKLQKNNVSNTTDANEPATPAVSEKKASLGAELTLLMVIGASLVDAINPCAFAVLVILMTTVLATGGSKKALLSGVLFSVSIFISYLMMGLGLYKALGLGGTSKIFIHIIGWLAIILGILNIKDYLWYGKGVLMEVPVSWRPKLKSLIKSVTSPIGAFFVGFLVSLFLLPCTSGPYIVILGMLAEKETYLKALFYLVFYNLIFISPMILITYLVYRGYNPEKLEALRQKNLRNLHLIAGVILLILGFILVS